MKTPHLLTTVLSLAFASLVAPSGFGQGNLTPPPGAPAPTMKSLDEIDTHIGQAGDRRTPVDAAHTPGDASNTFIISGPGSYFFTGNRSGDSGKHGISIQSNDVTLDLNGFALISGGGGATRGVNVPSVVSNFCVRNGSVSGWTDGGVRADLATATLVEKLRLSLNTGATGLAMGDGLARDCVATGNATGFVGVNGASFKDCSASGNTVGFTTGDRCQISGCISTINTSFGFNCGSYCTIIDCTSSRNGATGILVVDSCTVSRCNSSRNIPLGTGAGGHGIYAGAGCTIADCTADNNTIEGIHLETPGGFTGRFGGTVRNCTARGNGGAGIYNKRSYHLIGNTCELNHDGIIVFNDTRVDGNSCVGNTVYGITTNCGNVVVRNSCDQNGTDFNLLGGVGCPSANGPIVDMTGTQGTITSTSPWANFRY